MNNYFDLTQTEQVEKITKYFHVCYFYEIYNNKKTAGLMELISRIDLMVFNINLQLIMRCMRNLHKLQCGWCSNKWPNY